MCPCGCGMLAGHAGQAVEPRQFTYGDGEWRVLTEKNANGRKQPPALTAARALRANFAHISALDRLKVRARARPPHPAKEMQQQVIDCDKAPGPLSQHWIDRQQALKREGKRPRPKLVKGTPPPLCNCSRSTTPNLCITPPTSRKYV